MSILNIVYEDDYLVIVDKPPGLVSTPSQTQTEPTLADILNTEYEIKLDRGGLVHRLDKDTSGLVIAAKTPETFDNLQSQFATRVVKKEYLALVHGRIEKPGKVEGSIMRNPGNREKFIVGDEEDARTASTEYEPVGNFQFSISNFQSIFNDLNKNQQRRIERSNYNQFTLIRCKPLTGRTHQIRVHLKYIAHPIVGDEKYAGRKTVRLDHRWCQRQFLHAAKISFEHPVSGKVMEFESDLPEDLKSALNKLDSV